jgi:hypothetical protein
MKTTTLIVFILLFIIEAGFCQKPAPPLPPPGPYDTTVLHHYYYELKVLKEQEDKLVSALIGEIDSTKHPALRDKLIHLLGEIDHEKSSRLIVNNIAQQSEMVYYSELSADSRLNFFPYYRALRSKKSLHALPFIKDYLQECRTDQEIMLLEQIIATYIVAKNLNPKWITGMMALTPQNTCREQNVQKIIEMLSKRDGVLK